MHEKHLHSIRVYRGREWHQNYLSGYPKDFDSKNYQDNVDIARKRADGDFSEVWGAFPDMTPPEPEQE